MQIQNIHNIFVTKYEIDAKGTSELQAKHKTENIDHPESWNPPTANVATKKLFLNSKSADQNMSLHVL